jgi:acyl carrier protein
VTEILLDYIHRVLLNGRLSTPIAPDDDLLGSGIVDSIGMLQIIRFVETQFHIAIPFEDIVIENFESVGAMTAYLESREVSP